MKPYAIHLRVWSDATNKSRVVCGIRSGRTTIYVHEATCQRCLRHYKEAS